MIVAQPTAEAGLTAADSARLPTLPIPLYPDTEADPMCPPCHERFQLNKGGLCGSATLPWHDIPYYNDAFCNLLLR